MSSPRLSVICAVLNAEKYLRRSLDSVFEQTFKDFELIVINDGSTDRTRDIVIEYLDRPNVILLENKYNEGIPVSRNRGLLHSKGEFIAIHDGDDISLPERFEKQISVLKERKEIAFLGSHAKRISETEQDIGHMTYPPVLTIDAIRLFLHHRLNPIIDPTSMYRRDVVLDCGGYRMEEKFNTVSDLELWFRLISKRHLLTNIQEPLIKYRINSQGLTRQKKEKMIEATNVVWGMFRRKKFPKVPLRADYFRQESFTEFSKGVKQKQANDLP